MRDPGMNGVLRVSKSALVPSVDEPPEQAAKFVGKDGRRLQISKPVRGAIHDMVEKGLTRAEAAEANGIKEHALYCALRKPHVRAFQREVTEDFRSGATARAYHRLTHLSAEADSEHVQFQASRYLVDKQEGKPVARSLHQSEVRQESRIVIGVDPEAVKLLRLIGDQPVITAETLAEQGITSSGFDREPVETAFEAVEDGEEE